MSYPDITNTTTWISIQVDPRITDIQHPIYNHIYTKTEFEEEFNFNIIDWIDKDYTALNRYDVKKKYNFYFTKNEINSLSTQLKSNKSTNLNSKLRDMTVYTSTNMFFYNVKEKSL